MDIDLLSKMVKELILDNDEVSLPGVGSFVAELVPSSFSDKGYTINPPYKRLSFRKKADASDNVLIDFYAKSNNVDKETASKIVIDFLSEMQKVLELRKSIVFPGLGKLRATKENIFFFVADEDLDIYPEGFGLEPISLKTHEETPAEVSATIAALQDILNPEETESQSGSGEQPEAESKSGSEEPSEAVSGPEDAPEVTGGGQPESSLEAEVESDSELQSEPQTTAEASELQFEQQATSEESELQLENESQHEAESEQETAQSSEGGTEESNEEQSGEASSSEDVSETTGDEHPEPESSQEAEDESDNAQKPEQQTTAEESDHQSENESQSEAEGEQENEPQQEPESDNEPDVPVEQNNSNEPEQPRTEPAKKSSKGWKALIWTAVAIAALAVTFIVGFVILAHIAPDFIDSILYTQEELEIINH